MEDVSAIVVTHNSEAEVGSCLDALSGCGQVLVVDNASRDRTMAQAARRPWVEAIANGENRGFAAAVNQGARLALGRYLLLLNPDATLTSGGGALMAACERSGLSAGCLTGSDGTPQKGFTIRRLPTPASLIFECLGVNAIWPRNPVNIRYRCLDLDLTAPARIEQPAGAFMMIRRDVFEKIGGFDERFWPVWYEDVDFCRRAIDAGYAVEYAPGAQARHSGAHAVGKMPPKYQRFYWYGSLLKYVLKHHRPAFRMVCCSIILGSLFRSAAGIFRRGGSQSGEYSQVFRLAAASLLAGEVVCPIAAGYREDGPRRLGSPSTDSFDEASCRRKLNTRT